MGLRFVRSFRNSASVSSPAPCLSPDPVYEHTDVQSTYLLAVLIKGINDAEPGDETPSSSGRSTSSVRRLCAFDDDGVSSGEVAVFIQAAVTAWCLGVFLVGLAVHVYFTSQHHCVAIESVPLARSRQFCWAQPRHLEKRRRRSE